MIYQGKAFKVLEYSDGIAELRFDLEGESVNKFNQLALEDLDKAITVIENNSDIRGVILSSGKDVFVVGADITEFVANFRLDEDTLFDLVMEVNRLFSRFEDLDMPTVAAINGTALGGGFEVCLAADYRVLSTAGTVGLPEVKLGIFPGWGGTVRLARLSGADNAIEWICTGKTGKPDEALKIGAVDAVVEPDKLMDAAGKLLQRCLNGDLDFRARKQEKLDPLTLPPMESMMVFETAKPFVAQKAGPHMPAPVTAVKTIQKHATMPRDKALEAEAKNFVKMAKTPVAEALVGLFLSDQFLKKQAREWASQSAPVEKAAVLGAGIMGGGIAYQSALKKTPILMKDINQQGIDLGLKEAGKLLDKRITKGRLDSAGMAEVLNRIVPTLSYGDFETVDVVVEAVLEKESVKKSGSGGSGRSGA